MLPRVRLIKRVYGTDPLVYPDGIDRSTVEERCRFRDVLEKNGLQGELVPLRTVGVQGDHRSYRYLAVLVDDRRRMDWAWNVAFGSSLPGKLSFINGAVVLLNPKR